MPASVDRCVKRLTRKYGKDRAWAICQASYNKSHRRKSKSKRKR